MGVLVGILTMAIVAGSNCLTSTLLLGAALKTGNASYEGIAEAAGGRGWKVWEAPSLGDKQAALQIFSLTCLCWSWRIFKDDAPAQSDLLMDHGMTGIKSKSTGWSLHGYFW